MVCTWSCSGTHDTWYVVLYAYMTNMTNVTFDIYIKYMAQNIYMKHMTYMSHACMYMYCRLCVIQIQLGA